MSQVIVSLEVVNVFLINSTNEIYFNVPLNGVYLVVIEARSRVKLFPGSNRNDTDSLFV